MFRVNTHISCCGYLFSVFSCPRLDNTPLELELKAVLEFNLKALDEHY